MLVAVRDHWFPLALSGLIVSAWTIIATLYLRAAWMLERWPRLYLDDPKPLALGLHYDVTGYAIMVGTLGTLLALGYSLFALALKSQRLGAAMALSAALLSVALHMLTPCVSWYLD